MKLVWDQSFLDDYVWWQTQDRKIVKRINMLIKEGYRKQFSASLLTGVSVPQ